MPRRSFRYISAPLSRRISRFRHSPWMRPCSSMPLSWISRWLIDIGAMLDQVDILRFWGFPWWKHLEGQSNLYCSSH